MKTRPWSLRFPSHLAAVCRTLHVATLATSLAFATTPAHATDQVMWLAKSGPGSSVKTAHLNGDNPGSIWAGLGADADLALDTGASTLYWADNSTLPGRLMSGAKDGSGASTVVATTVAGERIHEIAIDPAGTGTAYWVDYNALHAYSAALPNGAPVAIPTSALTIRDIALDLRSDKLHLYVYDGVSLWRSDLPDGANEVLVEGALGDASTGQIALDTCNDRVYAIGTTTPHPGTPDPFIRRASLTYGASPTLGAVVDVLTGYTDVGLQGGIGDHMSLALDLHRKTMYWTSYTPSLFPRVHRAGLNGAGILLIHSGTGAYSGLVLDVEDTTCVQQGSWFDMGGATDGLIGWPGLEAVGVLSDGSLCDLELRDASPSSPAGLFLALASMPVPFKGGTLKAFPFLEPLILFTSAAGTIEIPFAWPAGIPAGLELWAQYVILDAATPHGMSLSNAVLGITE